MISAWVLYFNVEYRWEYLTGTDLASTASSDWGLPEQANIILVLQNGFFAGAWVEGVRKQ